MSSDSLNSLTEISPALTDEFLSDALSKWFQEPVTYTHWENVSEMGKGDYYLSEVFRIKLYGISNNTPKYVQVVLKVIPRNVCRRLTYRSHDFFKNEIVFYQQVLPELLKFQAEKNVPHPFNNYTKLFAAYSDGIHDIVCLEDANLEGFGTAVRQEGIDVEHCRASLKALAGYHALSFAMRDQKPEEFDKIKNLVSESYYDPKYRDWYFKFWNRICSIAIDAVEKEYPNSIYVDKVKEFAVPETYEAMIKAAGDRTHGVISHGDCWTNNFLYKYVDNKPIDTKLIDFQLTRCASPVLDLSFFIYACSDQDLRSKHYHDLLKYYHEVLSSRIEEMGSDPSKVYSWDTFMGEIKKYSYFGLAFSFESTPFIVLPPENAVEMNMEGNEKRNIDDVWQMQPFNTKEGRLREANNVVHCVDNGYI